MQRRDFIKNSALMGTAMMFPQIVEADGFTKTVKVAFYASKLNPVRLISGLIFDSIAEVYVEPLLKDTFKEFIGGGSISKSRLAYLDSSSVLRARDIEYEPYKASVVVYGVADYELYKQEQVRLQLTRAYDKERFTQINQYLKDEKVKLKLYNRDTTFRVGSDLTPNDLFNIDYVAYGKTNNHQKHIENLLSITNNSAFGELVV